MASIERRAARGAAGVIPDEPDDAVARCPRPWCRAVLEWDDALRSWYCKACGYRERK